MGVGQPSVGVGYLVTLNVYNGLFGGDKGRRGDAEKTREARDGHKLTLVGVLVLIWTMFERRPAKMLSVPAVVLGVMLLAKSRKQIN